MAAPASRINCVFDMDETLAQFNNLYALMAFISTEVLTKEEFDGVIQDIANDVKDGFDIGIFRPGLYKYFAFLQELKDKGILHSTAIYSNNGWLYTVSFMVSIINAWFPGLMCEGLSKKGVHSLGSDPNFREANIVIIPRTYPPKNDYKKQWATIVKLFGNASCGGVVPTPEYTFFYDDNMHDENKYGSNLKTTLGNNYIRNSAYENGLHPEFWDKLRTSFQKHNIINADGVFNQRIQNLFTSFVKQKNEKPIKQLLEEYITKKVRGQLTKETMGDVNQSLFEADEQLILYNGGYNFDAFKRMANPRKIYTIFGTHRTLENAFQEYNNHWIPPILAKLTEEEKADLVSYPVRANVAGGRRRIRGKTRKHKKQYKKRTYKKYSRK